MCKLFTIIEIQTFHQISNDFCMPVLMHFNDLKTKNTSKIQNKYFTNKQ